MSDTADLMRPINLMSSPGSGKTTLLVETLRRIGASVRVGVIEGDIETSLDAPMVRAALSRLPLPELDLVLIDNVGNLVCPAEFDVGEHARAMIYSITEGEEKPLKYPVMFRSADLVLINKVDLLPHLDFDMNLFRANLQKVNPNVGCIDVSARTGQAVDQWCDWLTAQIATPPAQ